jgi:hypothetical protein
MRHNDPFIDLRDVNYKTGKWMELAQIYVQWTVSGLAVLKLLVLLQDC